MDEKQAQPTDVVTRKCLVCQNFFTKLRKEKLFYCSKCRNGRNRRTAAKVIGPRSGRAGVNVDNSHRN